MFIKITINFNTKLVLSLDLILYLEVKIGAESRTRTGTRSLAPDFESGVSTSFTTSAKARGTFKNPSSRVGTDLLSHREARQYHGYEGALLLCSGWEQVFPPCLGHRPSKAGLQMRMYLSTGLRVFSGYSSQATRSLSTGRLHMLPCFHPRPIKQVVYL